MCTASCIRETIIVQIIMKFLTLVILCSVIRGLVQIQRDCRNNGSVALINCQTNPNIRIEKIVSINHYRLSLYSQNTWWGSNRWIECRNLCEVCETLPGINNDGEHIILYGHKIYNGRELNLALYLCNHQIYNPPIFHTRK